MSEIQGEVLNPSPVQTNQRLPWGGVIGAGGSRPFTVYHNHVWSFVVRGDAEGFPSDLVELGQPFESDAPRHADGRLLGRRGWRVEQIDPAGEWLPQLAEVAHEPGANGCRLTSPDPKVAMIDATGMHLGMERKGAIRVKLYDPRLGRVGAPPSEESYANYLSRYTLTTGMYFHCYAAVRMILINRGREAVPSLDHGWTTGFRRKVLAAGLIDPMPREALNAHVLLIRNRIQRWDALRKTGTLSEESYRRQRDEATKLTGAMTAAWDRQFASGEHVSEAVDSIEVTRVGDTGGYDNEGSVTGYEIDAGVALSKLPDNPDAGEMPEHVPPKRRR